MASFGKNHNKIGKRMKIQNKHLNPIAFAWQLIRVVPGLPKIGFGQNYSWQLFILLNTSKRIGSTKRKANLYALGQRNALN